MKSSETLVIETGGKNIIVDRLKFKFKIRFASTWHAWPGKWNGNGQGSGIDRDRDRDCNRDRFDSSSSVASTIPRCLATNGDGSVAAAAMSRFLAEQEARRKELGKQLVASVAGIEEDNDPENARLALDFCLDHFARPQTSQLLLRSKDVHALYARVTDKMRAFSEHARADKVLRCLKDAEASMQDETVFAAITNTLHLLSHAPTRQELDDDARLLRQVRDPDGTLANQPTAEQLLLEVRDRLNLRKITVLKELKALPDNLVDQDWLDETFSSSSELSDLDSESDSEEVSPSPSSSRKDASDVESEVTAEPTQALSAGEDPSLEDLDEIEDQDIWLQAIKREDNVQAQQRKALSSDDEQGGGGGGGREEENVLHFNARCYDAYVRAFKRRENIVSDGANAFVPGCRDRIVHEAEVCRASLLALHGSPSQGLIHLNAVNGDPENQEFKLCANISLAHTSHGALEELMTPILHGLDMNPCDKEHDARKAAKDLLDALFVGALDEFVMSRGNLDAAQGLRVRVFRAAMAAQVEILGRFLYEGRLEDHFGEFFVSVKSPEETLDESGSVIVHPAPRAWQPMCERVYVLCSAVEVLRRLAERDGARHVGWPPWPADVGLRARSLHEKLLSTPEADSSGTSAPWRPGITDDETHPAVALLSQSLFAPLNELGSIVGKTVMNEVMIENKALDRLSEIRGVFFMQNELSLQVFLRDLFGAVDRDLLPKDEKLAEAMEAHLREFASESRVPQGCLAQSATSDSAQAAALSARLPGHKREMDDEQRSALLTNLLHADLEDYLAQSSLDRVHVDYQQVPHSDRFKTYGVRALSSTKLIFDVQPPLDAIVDAEALEQYSAIFSFLLVIKRTSLVLCRLQHNLRRDTLERRKRATAPRTGPVAVVPEGRRIRAASDAAMMHRIDLMLVEHLHFVSNLHAFIVNRLADVSWARFVADAKEATRIDHVYELHRAYLRRVCIQCMLAPDTPRAPTRVREAVDEMLECSLRFRVLVIALWRCVASEARTDVDDAHTRSLWKSIKGIHAKFSRASRFLLIMLSQRASLGGAKHLEDVLTRLDFNQACRRKPLPAQSFPIASDRAVP
ncbi:Gamma-tubulin complex component 6 [Hondaea fermentalgiana]|uniref:Spindle pole body component n=1 Tax=Hondaea fermentalgiana TaxID=2315210 RepID=A0A2R5GPF7_9STRA|nr:Gamma-tubulin complex component 6 [Hondaea fermentalgiana]|eukprot:GBG32189.1 Gamma-tubulin complex component 6 [Hondaea fermentalgiana]